MNDLAPLSTKCDVAVGRPHSDKQKTMLSEAKHWELWVTEEGLKEVSQALED